MSQTKIDLNNLEDIFDKLDKEAEVGENYAASLEALITKTALETKPDLNNLTPIFDKLDEEAGESSMGTRLNWSKAGISNHEIVESKSRNSNAIHNSYDGVCSYCGKTVDTKQGLLEMTEGKWSVIHPDCVIKRSKKRKERNG